MRRNPRDKCIVCERDIKYNRESNAITCSRKCSRIYTRVRAFAVSPLQARLSKLRKEVKQKVIK